MNKQEMIEKLKDPKQGQALGLLSEKEQAIFKKAGPGNMLWLCSEGPSRGLWTKPGMGENPGHTYALKPDYQPEPEYVDIEIVADGHGNLRMRNTIPGKIGFWRIDIIPGHKDFDKFWSDICKRISLADVSGAYRSAQERGHKVYARFVKESNW